MTLVTICVSTPSPQLIPTAHILSLTTFLLLFLHLIIELTFFLSFHSCSIFYFFSSFLFLQVPFASALSSAYLFSPFFPIPSLILLSYSTIGSPKIPTYILDFSHLCLDIPKFQIRHSIFLICVWTSQNSNLDTRFFSCIKSIPWTHDLLYRA